MINNTAFSVVSVQRTFTPAEKLMRVIFGEDHSLFYSYIIVEPGRKLTLEEAIEAALDTLPPKRPRFRIVIKLRFLDDDHMSFEEIGQREDMGGVTRQRAKQLQACAIRLLRLSSYSKILKEFIVPSPESLKALKDRLRNIETILEEKGRENSFLRERSKTILRVLGESGVNKETLDKFILATSELNFKTALESVRQQKLLHDLMKKHPQPRTWNAVRISGVSELDELEELVATGKIKGLRNIGDKSAEFLKSILKQEN